MIQFVCTLYNISSKKLPKEKKRKLGILFPCQPFVNKIHSFDELYVADVKFAVNKPRNKQNEKQIIKQNERIKNYKVFRTFLKH